MASSWVIYCHQRLIAADLISLKVIYFGVHGRFDTSSL